MSIKTRAITGHCLIGIHGEIMGSHSYDFCHSCKDEEEEESIEHYNLFNRVVELVGDLFAFTI